MAEFYFFAWWDSIVSKERSQEFLGQFLASEFLGVELRASIVVGMANSPEIWIDALTDYVPHSPEQLLNEGLEPFVLNELLLKYIYSRLEWIAIVMWYSFEF